MTTRDLTDAQILPVLEAVERMMLAMGAICTNGGTQGRAELNEEMIQQYYRDMQAGDIFPPLTVFYDGQSYWLADGFHRFAAYRLFYDGHDGDILVQVHQGTVRDAILYSFSANSKHGLRRSNADKQRSVDRMLRDEEWGRWSDHEIARRCAVDHKTVSAMRAKLEASGEIPQYSDRQTADGRVMRTAGIRAANERRATDLVALVRSGNPHATPDGHLAVRPVAQVVYDAGLYQAAHEAQNAARIDGVGNKIKKPVAWQAQLWCCTGNCTHAKKPGGYDLYGLIELERVLTGEVPFEVPFRTGPSPETGYLGVLVQYGGIVYVMGSSRVQVLEHAPAEPEAPQIPLSLRAAGWQFLALSSSARSSWVAWRTFAGAKGPVMEDTHLPTLISAADRAQRCIDHLESCGWCFVVEEGGVRASHASWGRTEVHEDMDELHDEVLELEATVNEGPLSGHARLETRAPALPGDLAVVGWQLESDGQLFWCLHRYNGWKTPASAVRDQVIHYAKDIQSHYDALRHCGWTLRWSQDQRECYAEHAQHGEVGPCSTFAALHRAAEDAARPPVPEALLKAGWQLATRTEDEPFRFYYGLKGLWTEPQPTLAEAIAACETMQQQLDDLKALGWGISQYRPGQGAFAAHGTHGQVGPYLDLAVLHTAVLAKVAELGASALAAPAAARLDLNDDPEEEEDDEDEVAEEAPALAYCSCGVVAPYQVGGRRVCDVERLVHPATEPATEREQALLRIYELLDQVPAELITVFSLLLGRCDPAAFGLEQKQPDDRTRIIGRLEPADLAKSIARALVAQVYDDAGELELQLLRHAAVLRLGTPTCTHARHS